MDAAENDVLCIGLRGYFGELVAVAGEVGKADDLVALVVVAEQDGGLAQFGARGCYSLVHGVVRKSEVVFEGACNFAAAGANGVRRGRSLFVNYQVHSNPPSALRILLGGRRAGLLKANRHAVDALKPLKLSVLPTASKGSPPTGLLQPFHVIGCGWKPAECKIGKPATAALILTSLTQA